MAKFEVIMPKLGESIIEATITKWLKQVGDTVEEDDAIVEIATDKVDSEIPSPVEGKIIESLYNEGDVVAVGKPIAVIEIEGDDVEDVDETEKKETPAKTNAPTPAVNEQTVEVIEGDFSSSSRFYSPLVKSIAKKENISLAELEQIPGSGKDNRVNKQDILKYLETRGQQPAQTASATHASPPARMEAPKVVTENGDEIIEMDRMRKLIADHMVMSKQVSPHVTSFIEVDVTNIVNWRNKVKDQFMKRENQKITFTPIFIEAAAKTLRNFPTMNASVDGAKIILRKNVNVGMATALPNGNLIVPVIKNADTKTLGAIGRELADLSERARTGKLKPDDYSGGSFSISSLGGIGGTGFTPIVNAPQAAILGISRSSVKPVWNGETEFIPRTILPFSLSYDHRIIDGAEGARFCRELAGAIEKYPVLLVE